MESRIEEIVAENSAIKEFIADRDASECSMVVRRASSIHRPPHIAGCRRRCLLRDSLSRPIAFSQCAVIYLKRVYEWKPRRRGQTSRPSLRGD